MRTAVALGLAFLGLSGCGGDDVGEGVPANAPAGDAASEAISSASDASDSGLSSHADAATGSGGASGHDGAPVDDAMGADIDADVSTGDTTDGAPITPSDAAAPFDLRAATIYGVFTSIFSQNGNFSDVTAKLTDIRDLGFNVLWLMPVMPWGKAINGHPGSPGSPYCVHDYYAVNPDYGTADDLKTLVATAHGLGMKVILDEVLNHTSWDNPLITLHPDWYEHTDGNVNDPNTVKQAFTWADAAQLNYKASTGLSDYMAEMLQYWIKTFDVDGFRFDTADNPYGSGRKIPATFWQGLRPKLESAKAGVIMLGEEEDPQLALAPFDVDYGWHLQGLYGAGGLQQIANGGDPAVMVQEWHAQRDQYPTGMLHMTLLQDWDLDEDLKLYGGVANTMAAAVFNFTIDGVPLLFNGEEVGNDNSTFNAKAAIDWNGPHASAFRPFYKSLLILRNASSALQQGQVTWIANSAAAHVVSYARSDAQATFLVTINFSGGPVTGTLSAPASGGWTDVSPAGSPGKNTHTAPPSFSLAAYDFAVFRAK